MSRNLLMAASLALVSWAALDTPRSALAAPPRVLDVRDFGATPGDDTDDTDAIQKAIDTGGAKATIRFPAGVYIVKRTLALLSEQTYVGEEGAILERRGSVSTAIMGMSRLSFIVIEGLTFKDGCIVMGQGNSHIEIRNNRFVDIQVPNEPFGADTAIFSRARLVGSKITGNTFERIGMIDGKQSPIGGGGGILAYNLTESEIVGNRFVDVYQAISIVYTGEPTVSGGNRIADNTIINPLRMGMEVQSDSTVPSVYEGNTVRFSLTGNEDIGMSLSIGYSRGTIVRNNLLIRDSPTTGPCRGMGIEISGTGSLVTGNRVEGHWCGPIGVYADAKSYSTVTGNFLCGYRTDNPPVWFFHEVGQSKAYDNIELADCPPR